MNEQTLRVFSFPENFYTAGSPVLLSSGYIQKEKANGDLTLFLTFRSLSGKKIKSLLIGGTTRDIAGRTLSYQIAHRYQDILISKGESFGSDEPVFLENRDVRDISLLIREVIFEDNSIWTKAEQVWASLPEGCPEPTFPPEEILSADIPEIAPEKEAEGSKDVKEEQKEAPADPIPEAEESQTVPKKETGKKWLTAIAAVLGVFLALLLLKNVLIPGIRYGVATLLMDQGKYQQAEEIFTDLGDYRDSRLKKATCRTAGTDVYYEEAKKLLEEGKYEEAIKAFSELSSTYKDTAELKENAELAIAEALIASGDYDGAILYLDSVPDSVRIEACRKEAWYKKGLSLYNQKSYMEANECFDHTKGYKDTDSLYHVHDYRESVTKKATCETDGEKKFTCWCGDSYTEAIPATGHNYKETSSKEPTCTEDGEKVQTCSSCGERKTEVLKATGHKLSERTVKPTCTEDGYTEKYCACGHTEGRITLPATGHTTATGTCSSCGYNFTQPVRISGTAYGGANPGEASRGIKSRPFTQTVFLSKGKYKWAYQGTRTTTREEYHYYTSLRTEADYNASPNSGRHYELANGAWKERTVEVAQDGNYVFYIIACGGDTSYTITFETVIEAIN